MAYGYLGGSLRNLERIASGFLGDDAPLGSPLADPGVPASSGERYGAGWRSRTLADGSTMAWHSGMVPGYTATIMLWPEEDLGLVTLQNASGPWHAESLLAGPMALADDVASAGSGTAWSMTPDPLYPAALGMLTLLTAILTWWAVEAARSRPTRRRLAATMAALVAVVIGTGYLVQTDLVRQITLWFPDLAAVLALDALLLVVLIVATLAPLRHAGGRSRPVSPAPETQRGQVDQPAEPLPR